MELQQLENQFENQSNATEVALKELEEERQEQLVKLTDQNRRLSVFLTFFLTTFVVLFFAAMLVIVFRSIREDLFGASPTVQILSISAPVLALLALSIYFNWERITSPILYRFQKILFYPVDFAFKVWSAEFQHEFERLESFLRGEIQRKQDQIHRYEKRLSSQIEHGNTVEKLLKERITAQDYTENVLRGLLNSINEYVLLIDSNGIIPDYYSRNVIKLLGKEVMGESFSQLARFNHQDHINFMAFLSHVYDRDMDFYEVSQFAPNLSIYPAANYDSEPFKIHWKYRPLYAKNGQVLFLIAVGSENEAQIDIDGVVAKLDQQSDYFFSDFDYDPNKAKATSHSIVLEEDSVNSLRKLVAGSNDMHLKKEFQKILFRRPLKSLIGDLEKYAYDLAESEQKEIEFDYFKSMNESIDLDLFQKALPAFKGLVQYLIKEDLESPSYRSTLNKNLFGSLTLSVEHKDFGAKGYFFKLSMDGMGVSPLQIKSDLLKADLFTQYDNLNHDELLNIYMSKELNQFYQQSYMGLKNKIAKPTDLSKIKEYIEQLRGTIFLLSTEGVLTEFNVYIPESIK